MLMHESELTGQRDSRYYGSLDYSGSLLIRVHGSLGILQIKLLSKVLPGGDGVDVAVFAVD